MWNLIGKVGLRAAQAAGKVRAAAPAAAERAGAAGAAIRGAPGAAAAATRGAYQAGGAAGVANLAGQGVGAGARAVGRNVVPLGAGAVAGGMMAGEPALDEADPNMLAASEAVLSRGMPPAQMQEFMDATGARSPVELANALALYGQQMYDESPDQVMQAIRTDKPIEQWGPREHLALARLSASVLRTDMQKQAAEAAAAEG